MLERLKKMRSIVLNELKYIPKGAFPQGELRAMYWMQRMHSLGKKVTEKRSAKDVIQSCIEYLKEDYPNYIFQYDKNFFNNH